MERKSQKSVLGRDDLLSGNALQARSAGNERLLGTSPGVYRFAKYLLESSETKTSWREELRGNLSTFAVSIAALAAALICQIVLPPNISAPPFPVFACALLALVVNGRWGTIAALLYCALVLLTKISLHTPPSEMGVLLWNFLMRFLFLETFVVLLDFVRRRSASANLPSGTLRPVPGVRNEQD